MDLKFVFFFSAGILFGKNAAAQTDSLPNNSGRTDLNFFAEEKKDTTPVYFFKAGNPSESYLYPRLDLDGIQQFDPSRQQKLDFGVSGLPGGAAQPLFYDTPLRKGLDVGFHQFDLYQKRAEDLRFFRNERGFTDASFSSGNQQADGYLNILFSRSFAKGVNFAVEHHRLNQSGESFHFDHQQAKQSIFVVGLAMQPSNSSYNAIISYASNTADINENGGIIREDTLADRPFEEDVATRTAGTLHRHHQVFLNHYAGFLGKTDSTGRVGRSYTIGHKFNFEFSAYKFFEPNPENLDSTSVIYDGFMTNDRGLRYFVEHSQYENEVTLQTFKSGENEADFFEVGALHRFHQLNFEPEKFNLSNLFLIGRWHFNPSEWIRLKTYAQLGVLDNAGDYRIEGDLDLDAKKWGKLKLGFINQLYEPSLVQEKFYVSQEKVWENFFQKTLSTSITAAYEIPVVNIEISGAYHLINQIIYFDEHFLPEQSATPMSVLQLILEKDLKLWKFHFVNLIALQSLSEDFRSLPAYFSKHSLYFSDRIFKDKLDFRAGLDGRFYSTYFPETYNPLTGQFALQNKQEVKTYPQVDIFASLGVESFRAFLKMENVASWLGNDYLRDNFGSRYFYQIAGYPFPNGTMRWGISWQFRG